MNYVKSKDAQKQLARTSSIQWKGQKWVRLLIFFYKEIYLLLLFIFLSIYYSALLLFILSCLKRGIPVRNVCLLLMNPSLY